MDSSTKTSKAMVGILIFLNIVVLSFITAFSMIKMDVSVPQNYEDLTTVVKSVYIKLSWNEERPVERKLSTEANNHSQAEGTGTGGLLFLSLLKAVFHLSGLDFDMHVDVNHHGVSKITNWATSEINLLHNGMEYEIGSVTVPSSGLYFVYSRVSYHINESHGDDINLVHRLIHYRMTDHGKGIACQSHVTETTAVHNDIGHGFDYPSYIHCLIRMETGDMLSVEVNYIKLLRYDRNWSFLGAFVI